MGIRFECIKCHKKIVVHDRFANKQIKCPTCSFILTIPSFSDPTSRTSATAREDAPGEEFSNQPKPGRTADSRAPLPSELSRKEFSAGNLQEGASLDHSEEELSAENDSQKNGGSDEKADARRLRREEAEEDVEWDITPMVDVAFLLLIFFMLTASFSIQKAIPSSAAPQDKPSSNSLQREQADQPESFVIQIDEQNTYTIISNEVGTSEAANKQELIIQLKDLKNQLGEATPKVNIQAHSLSLHGTVVACMDAAREAGFTSFQMQSVEDFD